MSYCLVQFVEDGLYHVCQKSKVRPDIVEKGLCTASYKGMSFRAAIVGEGDKTKMEELKERCETKDLLMKKYKFSTPSTAHTASITTQSEDVGSSVRRSLFKNSTKDGETKKLVQLKNVNPYEWQTHEFLSSDSDIYNELVLEKNTNIIEPLEEEPKAKELPKEKPNDAAKFFEKNLHEMETSTKNPNAVEPHEEDQTAMETFEEDQNVVEPHEGDQTSLKNPDTANREQKKYYCPYCRSLYKQFARHLIQVHSGEAEVASVLDLKKRDPERLKVFSRLRAKGSQIFNSLQSSPTKIILPRRKLDFNQTEYTECYLCGNTYKSKFLYRHVKKCPNTDGSSKQAKRTAKKHSYKIPEEKDQQIKFSEDVLSGMQEGDVKTAIENDTLLRNVGKYWCVSYGHDTHLINLIRRKLRQLAEILIEMKNTDSEIRSMQDIFDAKKKQTLFTVIKKVCGYNKGNFTRAAMASELQTIMKQCAERQIILAKETGNEEEVKGVQNWKEVFTGDYNVYIGKHARRTLDENKWNKPKLLPLNEDLLKLNMYTHKKIEDSIISLQAEFSFPVWTNLLRATQAQIILFNRRRVGDVEKLKVTELDKAHGIQEGTVIHDALSKAEKVHASQYKRVESQGKKGRANVILLTKQMMRVLKTIISLRESANIAPENPYVFAKQGLDKRHPCSVSLRDMAYECGADVPKLLTGTKLRQHIATATQAFNFSTNDLSILAKFLGHTLQTHSEFYRLPSEALQLARISVVLSAIDKGRTAELRGKSLKELDEIVQKLIGEEDGTLEDKESEEAFAVAEAGPSKALVHGKPRKRVLASKKHWTTPEKHVMRRVFKRHLLNRVLPTADECHDAKFKNSPLKARTVNQIKAWVNNQHCKEKRVEKSNKDRKKARLQESDIQNESSLDEGEIE